MRKLTSIRRKIFIPVFAMLLLLPVITYIMFSFTASRYMYSQSKSDLSSVVESVMAITNDFFYKQEFFEDEENKKAFQAADYFETVKPTLQNELNETKIMLLSKDYEMLYPISSGYFGEVRTLYDAYMQNQLYKNIENNYYKTKVNEIDYMVYTQRNINHNSVVKYIVGYSIIPNTQKLVSKISFFIFLTSVLGAIIILPPIWMLVNNFSDRIKELCNQAEQIGENNFKPFKMDTNLKEVVSLNETMNEMSEKLYNYDAAQKMFFQNASHEFRTPLMSIKGYAEGLNCGVFEDTKQTSQIIINESNKLSHLVDDLLMLSRIDNLKQDVDMQAIDLREFVEGIIVKYNHIPAEKCINFVVRGENCIVSADEYLLESVVDNVISNCIRYAQNSINIDISSCQMTIRDDGIGFLPNETEHLFERFYKGKGGQTGLGLAIAKSSMEYMGGNISAWNNCGAVFKISFAKDEIS